MANVADNSFLLFVYPFLFNPSEFEGRVRRVEGAVYESTRNGQQTSDRIWETLDFPSEDMLAFVADYLNPKPRANSAAPSNPAIARLWRVTNEMQQVYGLADWADWRLKIQKRSPDKLTVQGLKAPFRLAAKLHERGDPLSQFIFEQLEPTTQALLSQYDPTKPQIESLLEPLVEDLNQIVAGPCIYDDARFAHIPIPEQRRLKLKDDSRNTARVAADNRWLIEKAYSMEILESGFRELPFRFGELAKDSRKQFAIQLALFAAGVGFLTVRAKPDSDSLDDWLTFLSVFRYVRGQRTNGVRAQKRRPDPNAGYIHELPFFPEPAGGVSDDKHTDGSGYFTEVLESLLFTARLPNEQGEWWSEVFIPELTLPFATLLVNDIEQSKVPELLFRVRNFFTPVQGSNPSDYDLRLDHPSLIPYARDQWFVFSLDGGAFVSCNAPHDSMRDRAFFSETLPDHLRDQYFILFLIVLQQRFLLMSLSQQVARVWPKVKDRARVEDFEPIRDALLEFAARGMFTQVMQREHHHRCYCKWQETFQIKELYEEVRNEVREMDDFLRMKRTQETVRLAEEQQRKLDLKAEADTAYERWLEKRFKFVGLVFGVPALIIAFLGINLAGITTQNDGVSIWLALGLSAGSAVLGALLMFLIERGKANKNNDSQGNQLKPPE